MLLLIFLIAGLLVGWLRGGGLSGLVRMGWRAPGLVLLPFVVEVGFRFLDAAMIARVPYGLYTLQCLRYAPLLLFLILNLRDWRVALAGLGVLMNFAVIMANGARMPISYTATTFPELGEQVQRVLQGQVPEYVLMTGPASARLWFFGDIIPLIFPMTGLGFASAGDVLLGVALLLIVQHGMARYSHGRHVRGSLAEREHVLRDRIVGNDEMDGKSEDVKIVEAAVPTEPAEETDDLPPTESAPPMEPPVAHGSRALSPRLAQIAAMVPPGVSVADVGCDHGKLAVHLAQRGAPLVVATDISGKSLAKAKALVREYGLHRQVKTRVSDGLKRIRPGEVEAIVIAGIGGPTICEILDSNPAVVDLVGTLVLQPQNAVGAVRAWIVNNGFRVQREDIALDEGRLYQVLSAVPGEDDTRIETLFDQEIGTVLVEECHPLLPQLLQERIATVDAILEELGDARSPKAQSRRIELIALRNRCEEVLSWSVR